MRDTPAGDFRQSPRKVHPAPSDSWRGDETQPANLPDRHYPASGHLSKELTFLSRDTYLWQSGR
ncbi:hypothetical protein ABW09_17080 [Pluralibacter gergoviae]|nr:hypothetical protein ABW09_17080 [Pluralibacter gergoviae]